MSKQGKELSAAVGKILAERRDELRLTQAQVAELLRIQRTSISNIESGKQVLLLDVFYDMCEQLKIPPTEVLDRAVSQLSRSRVFIDEIKKIVEDKS